MSLRARCGRSSTTAPRLAMPSASGSSVPEIYRQYSADRVLTLEDVTSIKITDFAAIEAAGVDRRQVAHDLLDVYLRMIFDFGFFHADPHPGNLFIYPLPAA